MSRQLLSISMVLLAVFIVGGALLTPGRAAPAASQATLPASTPCPTTTEEENEALLRRYYEEAWGQGNIAALEEVLAEDYVFHIPGTAGFTAAAVEGRAANAERIQAFRTDFPDLRITIEEIVAEEDTVAVRMTVAGTQANPLEPWNAPNTGRPMEREAWGFFRVACGRIAEEWVLSDILTMLRQLGIITDEELADAGTPTVATPMP